MSDEIEKLNIRLKQVQEAFNRLKSVGFDEEILVIYLVHKTKLKAKQVRLLLKHQEKFYRKIVGKYVAEKI